MQGKILGRYVFTAAAAAIALFAAPGSAHAGVLKAGAAEVDGSWHVGASAGQYASDGSAIDPANGNYDPTSHSTRRAASYGIQSRLKIRAIVVEGPGGNRMALVKNDLYIPQDLVWRRAAQLLEAKPGLKIGRGNLTVAVSHNHSSPYYSSTAWGAWAFQDVFDVRFYNYYAEQMAKAVELAASKLVPARVGASVTEFDKTHRHSFGPSTADDGSPAGYLQSDTDHDLTVIRFDDISDPGNPKPLANVVNWALHPEFLDGNDLISADYLASTERMADDRTGALTIWTQSAVGTSEPENSVFHNIHERLEFSHREYAQAEYAGRLHADAIVDTWKDIAQGTPGDPDRFVPFDADFANGEVAFEDRWFPGPISHPYPGVSNCRTDSALAGDPRVPIVGLPDCTGVEGGLNSLSDILGLPDPPDLPPGVDPGLHTDDFQSLGIPVPENYSAPAYTGLEEDINVHLQAFRIGEILFTACSCEQWSDQSANIETRTDKKANNEYLGVDYMKDSVRLDPSDPSSAVPWCTQNPDSTWKCRDARNPATFMRNTALSDEIIKKMSAQVSNPANGWNDATYAAQAESEPTDPKEIKGNYTHDDRCKQPVLPTLPYKPENDAWDKPCAPGEKSPSAELGYTLTVPLGMTNDYNGYIATYREYQRGDHYRKALTGWGPHSSDYMASRLVNMGRVLRKPDLRDELLPEEFGDLKVPADLAHNDARAQALGNTGSTAIQAYEAALPDDGGDAKAVKQPAAVKRFDGTFFTWNGGSNFTDNPRVKVQRKVGDAWKDYARQDGELPVTIEYPEGEDTPSYASGSHEWHWTAHFEAFTARFETVEGTTSTPPGTYRFVVDGRRRKNQAVQNYHLESAPFEVQRWDGIKVEDLKVGDDGRVSFKVGPRTSRRFPGSSDDYEIGPIDYPDTYDYGTAGPLPRFIKKQWRGKRDSAGVEWLCDECSFRPWLDAGDAETAKLRVMKSGTWEIVNAQKTGDRWVSERALAAGESAFVAQDCVRDAHGNYNGTPSAVVGAGGVAATGDCTPDALPVAVDDAKTVDEDSQATSVDVLANDTDENGGTKAITSVTQPQNGTVEANGDGSGLKYRPDANYCNEPGAEPTDDFTYTVNGGSTAKVAMTVTCIDDAPAAVADADTADQGSGGRSVDVLANDTDIDDGPKAVASVTQPANGTVAIADDGSSVSYRPNAGYCNDPGAQGADEFTYTLNGGSTATVAMTVRCGQAGSPGPPFTGFTPPGFMQRPAGCVTPTGRLGGRRIGEAWLGDKRARNRARLQRAATPHQTPRRTVDRFCLADGRHLRIGYPSRALLRRLSRSERRRVKGRAIFMTTSSPRYHMFGKRPGSNASGLRGRRFRVGSNLWVLRRADRARALFKVRRGRVLEIGLGDRRLSGGSRRATVRYLRSFR
jgi:hypothetical protein